MFKTGLDNQDRMSSEGDILCRMEDGMGYSRQHWSWGDNQNKVDALG